MACTLRATPFSTGCGRCCTRPMLASRCASAHPACRSGSPWSARGWRTAGCWRSPPPAPRCSIPIPRSASAGCGTRIAPLRFDTSPKDHAMDIGVFIPINNNGWIISAASPQYMPSFELNKQVVLKAEAYGLDFALSMIKLHGFGGKTEFWDHGLESFTLMAGLASVTTRIRLYASTAVLTIPPAIVARMASTIADISGGRFGVNIVSGWHKIEYSQMGLWPGDEHFTNRYDYSTEYVTVMKQLWETGHSDFKGDYFQMDDCRLSPPPVRPVKLVSGGQSDRGMEFAARDCDFNFALGEGVNDPTKAAGVPARMLAHAQKTGRDVGSY